MKKLIFGKKAMVPAVQKPLPPLAACLLMDLLGYASFGIPFFGEFLDLLWAPISAFVFFKMFGGTKGIFGGMFSFFEELMPGLDFIPTFTITWFMQYLRRNKQTVSIKPVTR